MIFSTAVGIFTRPEVEQFYAAFFIKSKSNAAIDNICKPAVERWQAHCKSALAANKQAKEMFERSKRGGNAVLIANMENSFKACKQESDNAAFIRSRKDQAVFPAGV
ncbi:hypothetical protein [Microbulbifer variabilis]|uniref:Uncharacterized protein n=1 Tax=Microbulbifer variabilis TaxID=266805 RepID=A0ABY4V795_9GAMM|nr:hypothetical protein [Microbulbifer variabilis]USD20134.1 hypothetical protein MJO52_13710 [Microbulbifer variabilis]